MAFSDKTLYLSIIKNVLIKHRWEFYDDKNRNIITGELSILFNSIIDNGVTVIDRSTAESIDNGKYIFGVMCQGHEYELYDYINNSDLIHRCSKIHKIINRINNERIYKTC